MERTALHAEMHTSQQLVADAVRSPGPFRSDLENTIGSWDMYGQEDKNR